MNVDILFIDAACSKPYDYYSLEIEPLGGTECSTIRLAEGFASKGHSVAVVQRFERQIIVSPNGAQYLPSYCANNIQSKNLISVRANCRWEKFPNSRKFLWLHDASKIDHNNMVSWVDSLIAHNVQGIAVSDWHIKNIHSISTGLPLKRIYSPVDELCYNYTRPQQIDRNQLVWLSSPHKGLKETLEVFEKLQKRCPEMKLAVFNPGYYDEEQKHYKNVRYIKDASKDVVRAVTAHSLAVFYPTQFEETFGLVAAEANALGTPVASYGVAALSESSCEQGFNSENDLIEGVLKWRESGFRSTGQDRFRFNVIYPEWNKLLYLNGDTTITTHV